MGKIKLGILVLSIYGDVCLWFLLLLLLLLVLVLLVLVLLLF